MPELPEVETVVRALRQPLIGRSVIGVRNDWPRHIHTPTLDELRARIHGCQFKAIKRRAKYLVFTLTQGETLIIHLRMSGHLAVVDGQQPADKHVHTAFLLDNGQELRFRDIRKFGTVDLVNNPDFILGKLGPEPLEDNFTPAILHERLNGRSRAIKPLLLDQHFIAGVGNIYADEALFYAKLHPTRPANSLNQSDISLLHGAIQKVLRMGIEREGASIELYLKPDGSKGDMQNAMAVFRRIGEPCYNCGRPIERIVLGGRSTHFCPQCQK
ncbi:MAG: DNA-formamidopyrimidine glycosylase [Chloroflexi bacterium]|nr:DNA-formamidopyrimidine glycosylase [Chloroflexota bacterium]